MLKIINKGTATIAKDLVCKHLENKNYIIIEEKFKYRKKKIDLIAYDNKTEEIVFVELKVYFMPNEKREKISIERQEFLKSAAKYYNYQYGLYDIPVRFDMVELFLNNSMYKIKHIRRVFN